MAAFAVASLTAPAARNAILELGGPEALSQVQAKDVFAEVLGRPVATQSVPVEALQGQLAAATDPIDMSSLLPHFPVQLTSVKQFATG